MSTDYTITRIIEDPTFENGKAVARLRVQFMVGDDGPFFESFEKAPNVEFVMQQRLSEFARSIRAARG